MVREAQRSRAMALMDDRVVGFGSCGLTIDLMAFGVGRSVCAGVGPSGGPFDLGLLLTRRAGCGWSIGRSVDLLAVGRGWSVGLVVFSLIDLSRFSAYPLGGCYLLIWGSWRFDLRALGLSAGSVTESVTSPAPNSKRWGKRPSKK